MRPERVVLWVMAANCIVMVAVAVAVWGLVK